MKQSSIGSHRHLVSLTAPGAAVADGDGAYTQSSVALNPPTWHCSLLPATAQRLERVAAGTVLSMATHIATGRYHSGITTKTVLTFKSRSFSVVGVANPEEQNIETVAVCVEVVA